jgi:hypothetical protein
MTAAEILTEHAAGTLPSDAALIGMIDAGIDVAALVRRWQIGLDIPRLDRVVYTEDKAFEFAVYMPGEPGIGAMTFVVRDHIGDPIDLAAWSPAAGRLALWCARGSMLGADTLFAPRMQDALPVHQTPLGWLRGLCRGVVVLDGFKAAPLLRRAEPLAAEDVAHGRELRKMLEVRPPRILVPAAEIERRAA